MLKSLHIFCFIAVLVACSLPTAPLRAEDSLIVPQSDMPSSNDGQGLTLDTLSNDKPAVPKETVAWGKLSKETIAPSCDSTIKSGKKREAIILTIPASFCKSASYADSDVCTNKVSEVRVEWKGNVRKLMTIMAENKMIFVNGTYKDAKDCWYPSATIDVSSIRRGEK